MQRLKITCIEADSKLHCKALYCDLQSLWEMSKIW